MSSRSPLVLVGLLTLSCAPTPPAREAAPVLQCTLRAHFYDVAQGLAVLVDLPDGRHILVDTGDLPNRPKCGPSCAVAHAHLIDALRRDLPGGKLDLVWITHQHADHIGGALDVLANFRVGTYVDNGRDLFKPWIDAVHRAAAFGGTRVVVVDPEHANPPLQSTADVRLTAIVPRLWPIACADDPNMCSIGIRIDACQSSILFTGDAGKDEEEMLDPRGPVALLQVGHHGSETASTTTFLTRVAPRAAVISAGHANVGTNRSYCHPRRGAVERLNTVLGGTSGRPLRVFDSAVHCKGAGPEHWVDLPVSDQLWATPRDGDVVLEARPGGRWERVLPR